MINEHTLRQSLGVILGEQKGDLGVAIRQLDSAVKEIEDARLRHYLEKRSYAKAMAHLNGEGCSHSHS